MEAMERLATVALRHAAAVAELVQGTLQAQFQALAGIVAGHGQGAVCACLTELDFPRGPRGWGLAERESGR